jgi:hypothetical protein
MEGANTSLQFHLRVNPADFARMYNAAQLVTGPVLAVSSNSPFLLGRRLWDETRWPSSVRRWMTAARAHASTKPARVSFGQGWVREGALELFAEAVALHPPLLPVLGPESPLARLKQGALPRLDELRLHQGHRVELEPRHLRPERGRAPAD